MAAESSGEEIREGFLCPICMKDLRTPSQLSTHFEEFHAEDKDILRQLRSVFGRAKNKILNRDEPTRPSSQIPSSEGSKTAFVSRGTPGSGGIDLLLWDSQEIGGTRNHLTEFRRIRQDKIEKFIVETNNILIRLDKLLKSGIYNSESTLVIAMKARKDVEKRVVPWESDNDVKYCRNCSKKFKVLVFRKHHCRLCGRVYCGECCDYISAVEANDILHSEKITKFGTESNSNESEDKNGIRTCFSCLELLQRHCQIRNDIQAKPDVVGLYQRLKGFIAESDAILPKFLQMAESINEGDTAFSFDSTMDTKVKLFRIFENIDALSKMIQSLGTKAEKQPPPRVLKLQRQIRSFAAGYLQENMFTTPSLPNRDQYTELVRMRQERIARQKQEEKERMISASLLGKESVKPRGDHGQLKKNISPPRTSLAAPASKYGASKSEDDSNTSEDDGGKTGGLFRAGSLRSKFRKKSPKQFNAVSITKSGNKGWGPVQVTMSSSPDPMMQQMDIIRGYIRQAKQERKFEEVALFEQNLKELELEYMKQRQAR